MNYRKYLTLSFDDGTVQDFRLVEIIDTFGLKCTFNLNSGLFGTKHRINHSGFDVCHDEIEASEVRELYKDHEVAVHTVTHPNLLKCDKTAIIREVEDDRIALEQLSGKTIIGMAYPGGPNYNDFVIETVLENSPIRYARTTKSHGTFSLPQKFMEWHPTCCEMDGNLFDLAEKFINADAEKEGKDLLFYVWGHSFELDKHPDGWNRFSRFCELVSGKSDISYVTNGEIYRRFSEK